nr:uncharacterized protein CI109_006260 [Kwoniella shandongensis]KAA5525456.1 hypothetical protein CI109_006260 [Kwoniella shandongensis]
MASDPDLASSTLIPPIPEVEEKIASLNERSERRAEEVIERRRQEGARATEMVQQGRRWARRIA